MHSHKGMLRNAALSIKNNWMDKTIPWSGCCKRNSLSNEGIFMILLPQYFPGWVEAGWDDDIQWDEQFLLRVWLHRIFPACCILRILSAKYKIYIMLSFQESSKFLQSIIRRNPVCSDSLCPVHNPLAWKAHPLQSISRTYQAFYNCYITWKRPSQFLQPTNPA